MPFPHHGHCKSLGLGPHSGLDEQCGLYLQDELNPLLPTNTLKNPCWGGGSSSSIWFIPLIIWLSLQSSQTTKCYTSGPFKNLSKPSNRISTSAHFLANMNWMGELYLLIMNMMLMPFINVCFPKILYSLAKSWYL